MVCNHLMRGVSRLISLEFVEPDRFMNASGRWMNDPFFFRSLGTGYHTRWRGLDLHLLGSVAGLDTGLGQRPYIREMMHSALNL